MSAIRLVRKSGLSGKETALRHEVWSDSSCNTSLLNSKCGTLSGARLKAHNASMIKRASYEHAGIRPAIAKRAGAA